jgi:hypothetical protein
MFNFFESVTLSALRIVVGLAIATVAVALILFILSVPEIIGMLIFG